jgi:hypothetical protein
MKPELVERWIVEWVQGPCMAKVQGKYTDKFFRVKSRERVPGFSMVLSSQYGREYEGICETKDLAIRHLLKRGAIVHAAHEERTALLAKKLNELKEMLAAREAR